MAANILNLLGTTKLGKQLKMVRFTLNVKKERRGEDFLMGWMWGVRKERSWGWWVEGQRYKCLEGDRQGTEQEFSFGDVELEVDWRHKG